MDAISEFDRQLQFISREWKGPIVDVIDTFKYVQIGLRSIGVEDHFLLMEAVRMVIERHDKKQQEERECNAMG